MKYIIIPIVGILLFIFLVFTGVIMLVVASVECAWHFSLEPMKEMYKTAMEELKTKTNDKDK